MDSQAGNKGCAVHNKVDGKVGTCFIENSLQGSGIVGAAAMVHIAVQNSHSTRQNFFDSHTVLLLRTLPARFWVCLPSAITAVPLTIT